MTNVLQSLTLQVPQTPESSVPRCDGCDPNMTLVYDHCKVCSILSSLFLFVFVFDTYLVQPAVHGCSLDISRELCGELTWTTLAQQNHPQVVDVGKLPDYPRRACGNTFPIRPECIDDPANLFAARVFIFRGTYDRCYLPVCLVCLCSCSSPSTYNLPVPIRGGGDVKLGLFLSVLRAHAYPLFKNPLLNRLGRGRECRGAVRSDDYQRIDQHPTGEHVSVSALPPCQHDAVLQRDWSRWVRRTGSLPKMGAQ